MKLKLTNREKVLLTAAGVLLVLVMFYYALIVPQLNMVKDLEKRAMAYRVTIAEIRAKADPENPVYKEYKALNEKTMEVLKRFYPEIIQEEIILILDARIKETGIDITSLSFIETAQAELQHEKQEEAYELTDLDALTQQLKDELKAAENNKPDKDIQKPEKSLLADRMTVTMEFKGSYTELYNFIKSLEDEKRSIVCSNLNITASDADFLTGDLVMDFYAIPKPSDMELDLDYLEWQITGDYGKVNPFIAP